ncbi:6948_t:CDS:2 [Dentiscutata heterogama]|uniref:6948_t:CDS:1 n=1 Tax=Dentiscutata heterogama TaxID=1316150 RepID=A0ACA9MKQ7_9GLOM|nr:6948_t:CDS:2 [Dentiscutata heterogama]
MDDRLFMIWDIGLDLERIHKAVPIHTGVAYIAVFGLSMASSRINRSTSDIYGVIIPYNAPEVLRGGVILQNQTITPTNTLSLYLQLMQNFWDNDPLKRPTTKEIKDQPSKRKMQQMTDADERQNFSHTLFDDEKTSPKAIYTSRALRLVTIKESNISSKENMLVIASYDDPGFHDTGKKEKENISV